MEMMLITAVALLSGFALMASRQAARLAVEARRVRRLYEHRSAAYGGIR